MVKIKKRVKNFIDNFMTVITRPEMAILPGQLAYFFVLAVIPTLTLVSLGAAVLNLSTDVIHEFLSSAFSESLAETLLSTGITGNSISLSVIVVIVVAYYIASNGASSIIITSNTIYGIKNKGYIKRQLKAFFMIFILVFLFTFMLIIPMFGDTIIDLFKFVNMDENITVQVTLIIRVLQGPILWFILFLFVKLIYTMAPDKRVDSNMVNYGALFTATLWMIVTYIYSIYINNYADYTALYGNLANLVILMLWFYFLAYVFTIGMALNYHKEENEKVLKEELKLRVSQ